MFNSISGLCLPDASITYPCYNNQKWLQMLPNVHRGGKIIHDLEPLLKIWSPHYLFPLSPIIPLHSLFSSRTASLLLLQHSGHSLPYGLCNCKSAWNKISSHIHMAHFLTFFPFLPKYLLKKVFFEPPVSNCQYLPSVSLHTVSHLPALFFWFTYLLSFFSS